MSDLPPSVGFHPAARRSVRFGPFRMDLSDGSLWRDGEEVRLPPRALAVLAYLVERPGRVVTKSALLDAVWQDAHVSETSLTEAVGVLRQALGDAAQQPVYIQTVTRRGYRFIAPLAVEPPAPSLAIAVPTADGVAAPARPDIERSWRPLVAAVAVTVAIATAAFWALAGRKSPPPPVTRASITLPAAQAPAPGLSANPVLALSPDGERLVYVAGTTGAYRLFLRAMNHFEAQAIPGTEGGHGPFFSPDGTRVGFFAGGTLRVVALDGSAPVTLADAPAGLGGWWGDEGTIVFVPSALAGISRIPSTGGSPAAVVAAPKTGSGYRWPQLLPGGRTIVATRWRANARDASVVAIDVSTGAETVLAERGAFGRVIGEDALVFLRGRTLYRAPWRNGRAGEAAAAIDSVMMGLTGAGQFAASDRGDLLYMADDEERANRRMLRTDAQGVAGPAVFQPRAYQNIAVCGERVVATILDKGSTDVWIGDVNRGGLTRLTQAGTAIEPVWSAACDAVTFAAGENGVLNIFRTRPDAGAPERLQASDVSQAPASWSPDGRALAYTQLSPKSRGDLWLRYADGHVEPLAATSAAEGAARFSPAGRWIAYQADEGQGPQVFLIPADPPRTRILVSPDGGSAPAWSPDGTRLYYRRGQEVVAVDVTFPGGPAPGAPRAVMTNADLVTFRPLADGGFLVLLRTKEHLPLTQLFLVLNWVSERRP